MAEAGMWNYAYQWWLASEEQGDYWTQGKGGQHIHVNPNERMIMVRLGRAHGNVPWPSLFTHLAGEVE